MELVHLRRKNNNNNDNNKKEKRKKNEWLSAVWEQKV